MNTEFARHFLTRARDWIDRARPHLSRAWAAARTECGIRADEVRHQFAQVMASPQWKSLVGKAHRRFSQAQAVVDSPRFKPTLLTAGSLLVMALLLRGGTPEVRHAERIAPPPPQIRRQARIAPQAAWAKVGPRLAKAESESAAAIEETAADIDMFFTLSRQGARPFAEEVLGLKGKAEYAGEALGQAASAVERFFSSGTTLPQANMLQNRFSDFVNRKFVEFVLDPARAQAVIQGAARGYEVRIEGIEAQLLIEARADLDDDALTSAGFPAMGGIQPLGQEMSGLCAEASLIARNDLAVALGSIVLSEAAGGVMSQALNDANRWVGNQDYSWLDRFTINVASGFAANELISQAVSRSGYNPEAAIEAKVVEALERMRARTLGEFRTRMRQVHEQRAKLREQTLRKAILEGGNAS